MSDRFLTFLDLDVKAPLLVVPVDLGGGGGGNGDGSGGGRGGGRVGTSATRLDEEGGDEQTGNAESFEDAEMQQGGARDNDNVKGGGGGGGGGGCDAVDEEAGRGRRGGGGGEARAHPVADAPATVASVARELLVVDLGNVSLTTVRLAQHVRRETDGDNGEPPPAAAAAALAAGENDGTNTSSSGSSSSSSSNGGRGEAAAVPIEAPPRRKHATGEVGFVGPAGSGSGKRHRGAGESWHAKFYDVYKVEVHRVGVLLLEATGNNGGGGGGGGVAAGSTADGGGGGGRWLVDPFDVKVGSDLCALVQGTSLMTVGRVCGSAWWC